LKPKVAPIAGIGAIIVWTHPPPPGSRAQRRRRPMFTSLTSNINRAMARPSDNKSIAM
jgi:hypothetical protein